jgi:hypothetical protein
MLFEFRSVLVFPLNVLGLLVPPERGKEETERRLLKVELDALFKLFVPKEGISKRLFRFCKNSEFIAFVLNIGATFEVPVMLEVFGTELTLDV